MAFGSKKPPIIVVCGEHNSGKSSLINLIVKSDVLPLSILRRTNPVHRVMHSEVERIVGTRESGDKFLYTAESVDAALDQLTEVAYFAPTKQLQGAIFVELQASELDQLNDEAVGIINKASFFIWCSNATQAWRNTEQDKIKSLRKLTKSKSVMVLTRGDHLITQEDTDKLLARIKDSKVFKKAFSDVVLVTASSSSPTWRNSLAAWRATGVADLVNQLGKLPKIDAALPAATLRPYAKALPAPVAAQQVETAQQVPNEAPATDLPTKAPPLKLDPSMERAKAPHAHGIAANIDTLRQASGFLSAFVFNLQHDQPTQQLIAGDDDEAFAKVLKLARTFKALNPTETDEMTVTLAEAEHWILFKYSSTIPGAVCAMRIARSSGNLGVVQRLWSGVEFTKTT